MEELSLCSLTERCCELLAAPVCSVAVETDGQATAGLMIDRKLCSGDNGVMTGIRFHFIMRLKRDPGGNTEPDDHRLTR